MSARTNPPSGGSRLLRATAVMASGTAISKVLGFVRTMMIAFVLGNGTRQADIFNVAMTVPSSLYMLFAGGTLNTVLVPQIVRAVKNDADRGEAYINRIITVFIGFLLGITVLVTLAVPWVMALYTSPSWRQPALATEWQSLLVLAYITMPQLFFYGLFFLIVQVLNAEEIFGPMTWAPIANNVVAVGVFGLYVAIWGIQGGGQNFTPEQLWLLGIGGGVGIAMQTVVTIPAVRRAGIRYRPRFDVRGVGLGHTFRIAKWTLFMVAMNQVTSIVVNNLTTSATAQASPAAGTTVYLNAQLIWQLPHSLLTVSLATALLPAASRLAAAGDMDGVARESLYTIRLATTFIVPIAFGMIVLARPFATLAFGHGNGALDAVFVANTLACFAVGLPSYTLHYLFLRAFYALEDTRSTFLLQVIIASTHLVSSLALVLPWNDPTTVAPRLAIALAVAYTVGALMSFRWSKRVIPTLSGKAIIRHVVRVAVASLPAALVAWLIVVLFGRWPGMVATAASLILASLTAVVLFTVVGLRMQVTELEQLIARLTKGRLGRAATTGPVVLTIPPEETIEVTEVPRTPIVEPPASDHPLTYFPDPRNPGLLPDIVVDPRAATVREGQLIASRFRLDELLASQGTTVSWRAFDQVLARTVLVHVCSPADPENRATVERARRAAIATDSRFQRVLDVLDDCPDTHSPVIVCEYVPGCTLTQVLRHGPVTAMEAAWIVREVSDALVAMHAQRLYHRQLNPDTVILTTSGNVKVMGFLVSDASHLVPSHYEPQDVDLAAAGRILYACLVGRWPGGPAYWLPAAEQLQDELVPARQANPAVPPALDRICGALLSPPVSITAAKDLSQALSEALGTALPAVLVERRVRAELTHPMAPAGSQRLDVDFAAIADSADAEVTTTVVSSLHDTAPIPKIRDTARIPVITEPSEPGVRPGPAVRHSQWRRVLPLVLAFALLGAVIAGLVRLGVMPGRTTAAPHPIVAVQDYDPEGKGGEHHDEIGLAIDADPATCWRTEKYNSPDFGNLKAGVGLILDLGQVRQVAKVTVALVGQGSNIDVLVPKNRSASTAPTDGFNRWEVVGTSTNAGASVVVDLTATVETRYVLVVLRTLPSLSATSFQGGICQVTVSS